MWDDLPCIPFKVMSQMGHFSRIFPLVIGAFSLVRVDTGEGAGASDFSR